jgi:3-oxoacyl-[acyl-carrier-protein] synthase II
MTRQRNKRLFDPFYLTGMGVVSPYGGGNELFYSGIAKQAVGIKPITFFNELAYHQDRAAEITNFHPEDLLGKKGLRGLGRETLMLMESLSHLISDSCIKIENEWVKPFTASKVSLMLGTIGPIQAYSKVDFQAIENPLYMVPSDFPSALACVPAGHTAIRYKIKGATNTFANGETASLDAIAFGGHQLSTHKMDLVVAGGVEEFSLPYALIMQGIAQYGSRQNPVLGEGAVLFSCERKDVAKKREAHVLAEVIAYSTGFHPALSDAFETSLNAIREQMGEDVFSRIDTVFLSDKGIDLETELFFQKKNCQSISPLLGFMHSASGAFKIAAAIASPKIKYGSLVLINDVSYEGNASIMLIKKMASDECL